MGYRPVRFEVKTQMTSKHVLQRSFDGLWGLKSFVVLSGPGGKLVGSLKAPVFAGRAHSKVDAMD